MCLYRHAYIDVLNINKVLQMCLYGYVYVDMQLPAKNKWVLVAVFPKMFYSVLAVYRAANTPADSLLLAVYRAANKPADTLLLAHTC